ncbi:Interferon-induced very large GTPase 1, partial [Tinamus guttatus]
FQISCQGATSITTFTDFLCSKISPALCQAVYEKTAITIARDMRIKVQDFSGNRAQLEVCILKHLAQEESFEKFNRYLYSPRDFFQEYIKKLVDEYCLDKNRRLEMFLNDSLTHYYENIQSAVFTSTRVVKDRNDRNDKISLWLDEFCSSLKEVLNLPRKDLKSIEHLKVTDIEFLNDAVTEALAPLHDELRQGFANADMSSFGRQPHTILAEQFAGCWEQCPFCGAVCTNTLFKHDGDHQLVFHRPKVLIGYKWYKTDNLVIDICSSSVASECVFSVGENKWIPYKKYREAGPPYSAWNIQPDTSVEVYWKWFVCHFRTQLEKMHNGKFQGKGEIPNTWKRITKQEALSQLEK